MSDFESALRRKHSVNRLGIAGIILLFISAAPFAHAQGVDVIRGQVVGPEGTPVSGVQVAATSAAGGVSRTTRTQSDGRYTITFPGSEGHYFMLFSAIGFAPRHFELRRMADEDVLIADVRLRRTTVVL